MPNTRSLVFCIAFLATIAAGNGSARAAANDLSGTGAPATTILENSTTDWYRALSTTNALVTSIINSCGGQSCTDTYTAPTTITSGSAPSALPAASAVACAHDLEIGTNRTYPHQIGVNDKVSCTETGTVFNFTYTWWQRKNPDRKGGWKKITSVNYGGPYIWPVRGSVRRYWESGWRWKGCKKGWEVHVQETGTVYFNNFGPARVNDDTDNETCP
jgi:hypothetical protein